MHDKQKVTLYLPPGIHRQLKIRAAIDEESMSSLVEQAVGFYLKYPDKVQEIEEAAYGKTHQVHVCPECEAAMVIREGQMVSLKNQPSVITEEFPLEVPETVSAQQEISGKEVLVTC
ncbi:MAG TPA: hypothetical protein DCF68_00305 [Cyanothece sp. UBA12306]|nr:hypothetical protein [Cyanothece sp. UBA12306]